MDVVELTLEDLNNPFTVKQLSRYDAPGSEVVDIAKYTLERGDKAALIKDGTRIVGLVGIMPNVQPDEWMIQFAVGNYEEFPRDTVKHLLKICAGKLITTSGSNSTSTDFAKCIGMHVTGNGFFCDTRSLRAGETIGKYTRLTFEDMAGETEATRLAWMGLIRKGIEEESSFDPLGYSPDYDVIFESLMEGIMSGEVQGAVVNVGDEAVGIALGRKDNNESYNICGVYVEPRHRLNNIGSRLVRALAHVFENHDFVHAGVLANNHASVSVFEKLGFSKEHTLFHYKEATV